MNTIKIHPTPTPHLTVGDMKSGQIGILVGEDSKAIMKTDEGSYVILRSGVMYEDMGYEVVLVDSVTITKEN